MTAIDREKLLAYIESEKAKNVKKHNESDDDYDRDILIAKYITLEQISRKIKSGAFDIPPEGQIADDANSDLNEALEEN